MTDPESRIRLWFVVYHLDKGGVEEVILTYARLLDKKKFSLTVICFDEGVISGEINEIGEVDLIFISTQSRIKRFIRIWSLAKSRRPHVVHNHACWYGLIIGFLVGAKCVETIHNVYNWFNWHEKIRYSLYLRLADKVVAVAEEIKIFTLHTFPFVNEKKFEVIYNGVDEKKFAPTSDFSKTRSELSIPPESTVIGFVGRLVEQKGLRYLLEAADQLKSSCPDAYFVLVGDGELRKDLEQFSISRGLSHIIFTGYQRDINNYMRMFDVFALPSLFEGLPIALLEAMVIGIPVIASRVGGVPEVIKDEVTGFLVEPKNVNQLARRIEEIVKDPQRRMAMGIAGKKRFQENFSAIAMVKRTENLYLRLCSNQE